MSGVLPPGLYIPESYITSTSASCMASSCQTIAGTPTTPGTYKFKLAVVSGSQVASREFEIIVQSTTSPAANQLPIGYLDRADCEIIGGWAYDPDIPTAQIMVHIYDGGAGVGKFLGAFETTGLREDVNAAYNIKGNHGFTLSTLPHFPSLGDGNKHTIYAYAIDDAGEKNPELINSPRSLLCPPPAPVGSGANLKQMANILDALSGALLKLQGLVR